MPKKSLVTYQDAKMTNPPAHADNHPTRY